MKLELISNPFASKGKGPQTFERVRRKFVDLGIELEAHYPTTKEEAVAVMDRVAEARSGRVVVVGGDGMIGMASEALVGTETSLALIPAGRGNDFARSLGLPRNLADACRVALQDANQVDTIRTDSGRVAVSVATLGFSAAVNRRAETSRLNFGQAQYTMATLFELPALKVIDVEVVIDGGDTEVIRTSMLSLANTQYFGGGMRIAPDASVFDGLLDLVSVKPVSRAVLLSQLLPIRAGLHRHHPLVDIRRVKSLRIETPSLEIRADGDHFGESPTELSVWPKSLWVVGATP